jgi:phosphatidate cytidylyltransferase
MISNMPSGNITAAIAGMAPRAERSPSVRGQTLRMRFLSSAILLPVAFGAVWLGGPYWDGLVCLFAIAMAWEWSSICAQGDQPPAGKILAIGPPGLASILAVAIATAVAAFDRYVPALVLLGLGAACVAATGALVRAGRAPWRGLGVLYVGLPCIAIMWIRAQHGDGLATLLWLLALVMAVDTGAFAAGRLIGGPKLAPRVSPSKTWAGLGGGVAAAMLIGWIAALLLGVPSMVPLIWVSAALALVEQAGDLAESAFKRRFGVKDSSHLIPGHGGVLDRVDGLLAVSVVVALAEQFFGGILAWTR